MSVSSGLRILFVAPYVPSPIRVRPFQFVRALARAGHRVTLAALSDSLPNQKALDELRDICEEVHVVPHSRPRAALHCLASLPTPTPLWAAYCRSSEMARLLQQLSTSGNFDVAHVEHLRAAHFAPHLKKLPQVFDAVDCITALRRQMVDQSGPGLGKLLAWEEWVKLRGYEPRAYRAFAQVVVTSQYDAEELQKLDQQLPVAVIPNGVDLDFFAPDGKTPHPDTLVFSGKMSYRANEDAALYFARTILPLVREKRPNVRFAVVGSSTTATVRELEKQPGITVTGYVDDLRPYLSGAVAAVCPMRIGVGIQNKALEAMAMARPVVCSPLVSRAFVEARGSAVRVAETPESFAQACLDFLQQPDQAQAAGHEARQYVEARHRWKTAAEQLTQLYEKARREHVPRD